MPDAGVDGKVGVGEAGSVEPIWVRGTAVGFVERSVGDWAFAKCEDKRMVVIASFKIDADILKDAVVVVVVGAGDGGREGKEKKGAGEKGDNNALGGSRLTYVSRTSCRRGSSNNSLRTPPIFLS